LKQLYSLNNFVRDFSMYECPQNLLPDPEGNGLVNFDEIWQTGAP